MFPGASTIGSTRNLRLGTGTLFLILCAAGCGGRPSSSTEMQSARSGLAATVLADGRVLITGGTTETGNATASAEIYDPKKNRFTPTGSMSLPRSGHLATLLPDGRVYLVGGRPPLSDFTTLADFYTAGEPGEIYDPKTGKFTVTAHTLCGISPNQMALLSTGSVLLTGGEIIQQLPNGGRTGTQCGEYLFDPIADRYAHPTTTTSLFLGSGASITALPGGAAVTAGGDWGFSVLSKTLVFLDPQGLGWRSHQGAFMQVGRAYHTATILQSGRILFAGGIASTDTGVPTALSETYDPADDAMNMAGSMNKVRAHHLALLLQDGRVFVTGSSTQESSAEIYDPATNSWTSAPDLRIPRLQHAMVQLRDGNVLIVGGADDKHAEIYKVPSH